jgi:integrase
MEYLEDRELLSLLEVAYREDRLAHMAILTSVVHALRVSEMRALTVDDVDGSYLHVKALKDGEERLEPLYCSADPLLDERQLAVHAHGIRQAGQSLLFGLSRQAWDLKMKALCGLAGVPRHKAFWHALRHTSAMMIFKKTTSLGAVKQGLRHRSWNSALVYLNESDNRKAYAAISQSMVELSKA